MNTPQPLRNRHKQNRSQAPAAGRKRARNKPDERQRWLLQLGLLFAGSVALGYFGFAYLVPFAEPPDAATFRPFDGGHTFPMEPVLPDEPELWSTLLPGHYFGLRGAVPNSSLASLMWFQQDLSRWPPSIRHLCRQEDRLARYQWTHHDLRNFGHQELQDGPLRLNTSFLRLNRGMLFSRIRMETHHGESLYSVLLYAATEHPSDWLTVVEPPDGTLFAIRVSSQLQPSHLVTVRLQAGQVLLKSFLRTNTTMDRVEEVVRQHLFLYNNSMLVVANRVPGQHQANFVAVQLVFRRQLHLDLELQFDGWPAPPTQFDFDHELAARKRAFEADLERKFELSRLPAPQQHFVRTVLSSMLGSIGYYYGRAWVDTEHSREPRPYGPVQLLAVAPCRALFPRGFLWDEGFHMLLLARYDPSLAMAIIGSWLSLMNERGWIPREVILGAEAESRVPREFLVQHSSNANPPSLLLAVEWLVDAGQHQPDWLAAAYPRLQRWFQWLNTSQIGPDRFPHSFRWRGRNGTTTAELNPKTLASGLDDYPRATHPTDDEIHLDLRCWMAVAARLMAKIGAALQQEDPRYQQQYAALRDNQLLARLHWSEPDQQFCDLGLHSTKVRLESDMPGGPVRRRVLSEPRYQCVAEFGYVNLFPVLMTLLAADSPQLLATLDRLADPEQLWTPYGLRSLSKSSAYYQAYNTEHDPPYWRGAVWINLNYLVVRALHHYGATPGPYQARVRQLHHQLRDHLVSAVMAEFNRTGYIWEQYDDQRGTGRGAHPFTGWSALVVLVLTD